MSEKLPRVTANEIIKIVEKLGFHFSRQSGSHKIYKKTEVRDCIHARSHALERR
ncbi:MAG: addiction module toxin, HicA family [Ruminiclostridium sp.]|nr:addiction module toxin, HicA family [Ruminiclostridium sp.]